MTREEALKQWLPIVVMGVREMPEVKEAVKMAITALEQQPCEDAISRQAVLDIIKKCHCEEWVKADIGAPIEDLPSVTPQPCEDCVSRQAVLDALDKSKYSNEFCEEHHIDWSINLGMAHIVVNELKPVTPQPKMGRCKDCKYFEYDSVAKVDGIPLIVAHEICKRWGDGCKSKEDGYCFLFEPKMQEVEE